MVTLIIALVALGLSAFGLYEIIKFEEDSRVYDCDNLDVYDDLEDKIDTLESAVNAHVVNIRELEAKVSGLKTEVEGLSTSISNIIEFADRTRGMAEENKRNIELDN